MPDSDLPSQRAVVDAFLAAARAGDFEGLLALLDPDVVLRADGGPKLHGVSRVIRGAAAVAGQAQAYSGGARFSKPALVNGGAGLVVMTPNGRPFAIMGCTVVGGKIAEMDILADPERLAKLDLAFIDQE
jgi:SnoaL-like domain